MNGREAKKETRSLVTFLSHWVKPILSSTLFLNLPPYVNNAFPCWLIHLRKLSVLLLPTQSPK